MQFTQFAILKQEDRKKSRTQIFQHDNVVYLDNRMLFTDDFMR